MPPSHFVQKHFDQKSDDFSADMGKMWLFFFTKSASGAQSGDFWEFWWRFGQKSSGNTECANVLSFKNRFT